MKKGKWVFDRYIMCCPKCNSEMKFAKGGIVVNVESNQAIKIDNFLIPMFTCNNPFCEWSKIKTDFDIRFWD